jgi:MOSC domain-containing protein YiiM
LKTVQPHIVGLYISQGGVPKHEISSARIGTQGIEGDRQRDLRYHGGPERALCLYSYECIERLRAEGHPIVPGATGENIVLAGLDWNDITPGTRLRLGDEVRIEITSYTTPCAKIARCFSDGYFNRIHHKKTLGESRLYAKVLQGGVLQPGAAAMILEGEA